MEKIHPFLKYSGNKFYSLKNILPHLPPGKCFIEPFVGSGAIFLNTDYPHYFLADINKDLITLYVVLQQYGKEFIEYCKTLFIPETEPKDVYLELRKEFNLTQDLFRKSALFVYINRHAHGGSICRYGVGGKITASYGNRRNVQLPEDNMLKFHERCQNAEFVVGNFTDTLQFVQPGDVIYCDPPYIPLMKDGFVTYHSDFNLAQHEKLVELAETLRGTATILISNHDCDDARKLYQNASSVYSFDSLRKVGPTSYTRELLAIYS